MSWGCKTKRMMSTTWLGVRQCSLCKANGGFFFLVLPFICVLPIDDSKGINIHDFAFAFCPVMPTSPTRN